MIEETRTYTIPLRKAYQEKPPYQRANVAVGAIRSFLSKHMKADEDAVKLSSALNESIWADGAANPPAKVTVVAQPDEGVLRVMTEDEHAHIDSLAENEPDSEENLEEKEDETTDEEDDVVKEDESEPSDTDNDDEKETKEA